MIKYVEGDLFEHIEGKNVVIPHVCNDQGGWGSGFVVPLGQKFPFAQDSYLSWANGEYTGDPVMYANHDRFELGNTQFVDFGDVVVANMVAQHEFKSKDNPQPLKYGSLVHCMDQVRAFIVDEEIHAPQFGSGLAGGDWDVIEGLIEEIWDDFSVTVYIYGE